MEHLLSEINNLVKKHITDNINVNNKMLISENLLFENNNQETIELNKNILIRWIKKILVKIYHDIKFTFGSKTFDNYNNKKYHTNNYQYSTSYYLYTNYNFIIEINTNNQDINSSHIMPVFYIQITNLDDDKKIKFDLKCEDKNPTMNGNYRYYNLYLVQSDNFNNVKISCDIFKNSIDTIDDEPEFVIVTIPNKDRRMLGPGASIQLEERKHINQKFDEYKNIIELFKINLGKLNVYKIIHPILYLDYIFNNLNYSQMKKIINQIDLIKIEDLNQKLIKEQYNSTILHDDINNLNEQNKKHITTISDITKLNETYKNKLDILNNEILTMSKQLEEKNNKINELNIINNKFLIILKQLEEKNNKINEQEKRINELIMNLDNYKSNNQNLIEKYDLLLSETMEKDLILKKQNLKLIEINNLYDKLQNKFLECDLN